MSGRSWSRVHNTSITQHQVAWKEWRKGENAGSDKPFWSTKQPKANSEKKTIRDGIHDQCCQDVAKTIEAGAMIELTEEEMENWTKHVHHISMFQVQTSVGTSKSMWIISLKPCATVCPECYTLDEAESELIESETSEQTTAKTKANCHRHHTAACLLPSEQTKHRLEGRHPQPPQCKIDLDFIGYFFFKKWKYIKVHQSSFNLTGQLAHFPNGRAYSPLSEQLYQWSLTCTYEKKRSKLPVWDIQS